MLDGASPGELLPCWASDDVDVGVGVGLSPGVGLGLGLGASPDAGVGVWFILAKSRACTSRLEK